MSQLPAMPIFWGDYWSKTRRLSSAEHRAYLFLLGATWMNNAQPFPDDDQVLAGEIGISLDEWKAARPAIVRFFDLSDGTWRNPKLEKVWVSVMKKVAANRTNGKLGGRPKGSGSQKKTLKNQSGKKPNGKPNSEPNENPTETQPEPNQNYTSSLRSEEASSSVPSEEHVAREESGKVPSGTVVALEDMPHRWILPEVPMEWVGETYESRPEVDGYVEGETFTRYFGQGKGRTIKRTDKGWKLTWQNWVARAKRGEPGWIDRYGFDKRLHRRA